jgi:hypothetical protein
MAIEINLMAGVDRAISVSGMMRGRHDGRGMAHWCQFKDAPKFQYPPRPSLDGACVLF